jgi:hypothetical protein
VTVGLENRYSTVVKTSPNPMNIRASDEGSGDDDSLFALGLRENQNMTPDEVGSQCVLEPTSPVPLKAAVLARIDTARK